MSAKLINCLNCKNCKHITNGNYFVCIETGEILIACGDCLDNDVKMCDLNQAEICPKYIESAE